MSYSMTAEQFAQRIAKTALLRQRAVSAEAERDHYRQLYERLAVKRQGEYDAAFHALQAERDQFSADKAELLAALDENVNYPGPGCAERARDLIAKHEAKNAPRDTWAEEENARDEARMQRQKDDGYLFDE